MMLRFTTSRGRRGAPGDGRNWTWQARIPAMIFAYGGTILAVLIIERLMHSATSASYAAIAVVPGGIGAGICAFALSFTPRSKLFILIAVLIVALLPLGVIALSIDFGDYRPIFDERAPRLAALFAAAIVFVTTLLAGGGVFPRDPEAGR